jgi:GGDEF domain-containing protein
MSLTSTFARMLVPGLRKNFAAANATSPGAAEARKTADTYPPDAQALFHVGERMLVAARQHCQAVSLLVLQFPDLFELARLFGKRAAGEVVADVMTELTRISGRTGLAVRVTADTFAMLMPNTTGQELHRALQLRMGKSCAVEFELGDQEILLIPHVQARTIAASDTVQHAYITLCRFIDCERRLEAPHQQFRGYACEARPTSVDLRRRGHLASPVLPSVPLPPTYQTFPPTIPVSMGLR